MSDITEVTIGRSAEGAVTFNLPVVYSHGSAVIPLTIHAPGLAVSAKLELEPWSGGLPRMATFFDELAAAWRGWPGAKDFQDDGGIVSMSATHDGKGLVVLTLTARKLPPYSSPGAWMIEIVIPIEPGSLESTAQQMSLLTQTVD